MTTTPQQRTTHHIVHYEDREEVIINGKLHSVDDKPAVTYNNGDREWYCEGVRHRTNNRPAVIKANMVEYYVNGVAEASPQQQHILTTSTYNTTFGDIPCTITKTCLYIDDKFQFIFTANISQGEHKGSYAFPIPHNWNILEINSFNQQNTYVVAECTKNVLVSQLNETKIKLHLRAFDRIQALDANVRY
jgi:hypothetical protein